MGWGGISPSIGIEIGRAMCPPGYKVGVVAGKTGCLPNLPNPTPTGITTQGNSNTMSYLLIGGLALILVVALAGKR